MCVYTESGDVCVGVNARQDPSNDSSRDICLCAPLSFYWLFMALRKNELIMIKWTEKAPPLSGCVEQGEWQRAIRPLCFTF